MLVLLLLVCILLDVLLVLSAMEWIAFSGDAITHTIRACFLAALLVVVSLFVLVVIAAELVSVSTSLYEQPLVVAHLVIVGFASGILFADAFRQSA